MTQDISRFIDAAYVRRGNPWVNSVRFHLARCRAAQNRFAEAIKHLASRKAMGKVVVTMV